MLRSCIFCCALLLFGCGVQASRDSARQDASKASLPTSSSQETKGLRYAQASISEAHAQGAPSADRKIIYEAEIKLVVNDFSSMESALPGIVKAHGGYLANAVIDRTSGEQRSGH